MPWTRGAVIVGILLLLAGFAVGVAPRSVDEAGQQVRCGTVLVAIGPAASSGPGSTAGATDERRCVEAATGARRLTWGLIAAGLLVGLAGWTAMRESPSVDVPPLRVA